MKNKGFNIRKTNTLNFCIIIPTWDFFLTIRMDIKLIKEKRGVPFSIIENDV